MEVATWQQDEKPQTEGIREDGKMATSELQGLDIEEEDERDDSMERTAVTVSQM